MPSKLQVDRALLKEFIGVLYCNLIGANKIAKASNLSWSSDCYTTSWFSSFFQGILNDKATLWRRIFQICMHVQQLHCKQANEDLCKYSNHCTIVKMILKKWKTFSKSGTQIRSSKLGNSFWRIQRRRPSRV